MSKSGFKYSWSERVRLSIAAAKLGYQAFVSDLQDLVDGADISSSEYDHLNAWYVERINEFNTRIGDLKVITENEVLPLEMHVRHIIDTGISLSSRDGDRRRLIPIEPRSK